MHVHELKTMTFDEALDLLESRLVDIQEAIEKTKIKVDNGDHDGDKAVVAARFQALMQDRAELEQKMEQLRQQRAAELSGETENLLTELLQLFDRIGARIDKIFD